MKLALGPIPFAFPNTAARVRAVRLHDLHHVATGYDTSVLGEAEIGAWEIGELLPGLRGGLDPEPVRDELGLWIDAGAVFRAFLRGRHTGNLYLGEWDEALLDARVGELRGRLRLAQPVPPATAADRAAFLGWALLAAALSLATSALVLAPLVLLVRALF